MNNELLLEIISNFFALYWTWYAIRGLYNIYKDAREKRRGKK